MTSHMDHYGGGRLPWTCVGASGLRGRFVRSDSRSTEEYEVLDASGGYASACLGADHPEIRSALLEGLAAGYVTDEMGSAVRTRLLDWLFGPGGLWESRFPASNYHVCGRNSGSEGMELALRLVLESRFEYGRLRTRRGHEDRRLLLAFEGAWHGWTEGARQLMNRRQYRLGLPKWAADDPAGVELKTLPFGERDVLDAFLDSDGERVAGVFVEPIQGDAGILVPPPGYLRHLSRRCQELGALLVADEVLTFAKTGHYFAMSDQKGPIPTDITVIGKNLGMGAISTSLVISRRELGVRPSGAVATSDLRPLSCVVMQRGLEYIQSEDLLVRSAKLGERLRSGLQSLACAYPDIFKDVRGMGFLQGLELGDEALLDVWGLRDALIRSGVYVEVMGGAGRRTGLRAIPPAMRIAPPLIASLEDIEEIESRLQRGCASWLGTR